MARVNMNKEADSAGGPPEAGVHLWEVLKCEEAESRNKDPMFKVEASRVTGDGRFYDTIMLAGPGWGIGKAKLKALGVEDDFEGELDPLDLIGKHFWCSTGLETYTNKEGKQRQKLKALIDELEHCGYQHVSNVPPGCEAPTRADTPF